MDQQAFVSLIYSHVESGNLAARRNDQSCGGKQLVKQVTSQYPARYDSNVC